MTSYFSFIFLAAFLPAVVVLYAVAPRRTRWVVLLIASYAFFFWLSRTLILALWVSTLSIYLTGLGLGALIRQRDAAVKAVKSGKREIRARYARKMKLVLAAGLIVNFGLLAAFKYLAFFGSIIDGALGRKSLGARSVAEGVILCTGASYHMSMEKVIADTVHIYRLMNLPKAAELPPEASDGLEACVKEHGAALITGALTDTMVLPLLRSGVLRNCRLVVKDPSKVLLTADTLDKLASRQVALETEEAARTLCITVNPVSAYGWKFDKDDFLHRMREAVDVPVINVKEELA